MNRGDGAGDMRAVTTGIGIPTRRRPIDQIQGREIIVCRRDPGIDDANRGACAGRRTRIDHTVAIQVPDVACAHHVDAIGHLLRHGVAFNVRLDRKDPLVTTQPIDHARRRRDHEGVDRIEAVVPFQGAFLAQCIGDRSHFSRLDFNPDPLLGRSRSTADVQTRHDCEHDNSQHRVKPPYSDRLTAVPSATL